MKWPEGEVHVDGQVVTLPHRFKAGIEVDSTFKELERAVIVVGFTKDSIMKVGCFHKFTLVFLTLGQLVDWNSCHFNLCPRWI